MNCTYIEIAISKLFNPRANIIVPNVSWGLGIHECDVLVLRKSGWAYEIEIKTSRADLLRDQNKSHGHKSNLIRGLYFAVPESLANLIESVPLSAGFIIVREHHNSHIVREATLNDGARKLTDAERLKVAHLGTMRIWGLKRDLESLATNRESGK